MYQTFHTVLENLSFPELMNPLPGATQTVIVAGNINGGGRQVQTLQGAPPFFKIDGAVVELKISV